MAPGDRHEVEIRACLERVLGSPSFAVSKRRSELLRYLMDRALAGEAESVTEYGIALDVFGKPPSFDPQRESTVRAEMSRLRRSLAEYYENGGTADPWRLGFSSRGYFLDVLPNVPELKPAAAIASEPAALPPVRRWRWAVAAVALLALIGWGGWRLWRNSHPLYALRAVIVLPFANLTGDPGSEYLADGLTEDLTDSLARIASLRVVARTSAFQFKGKPADIREIGRKVDADAVVEGSIQRNNGRLRVTVQVNRSADGYHILSRRFDGDPAELARIEREMTLPVLAVIRPGATAATERNPNPEAYDLFLKARAYRGYGTREAFEKVITFLNQAIQRDPEYADAYAALAGAYAAGVTNLASPPVESVAKVKAAAARAIELDPASSGAYAAEGYMDAMVQLDWKRGEEELRNAERLMPQAARTHNWLGQTLLAQGRFPEALRELKAAENLDPLSPAAGASVGMGYFMARQYDNAAKQVSQCVNLHPDAIVLRSLLGEVWESKGNFAKALTEYQGIQTALPDTAEVLLTHLYAVTGKTAEARAMAAGLERKESDPMSIAAIYGALGDRDKAFEWVERAYDKRVIWILKVHPWLDPIRRDARYRVWLKRAGLAE